VAGSEGRISGLRRLVNIDMRAVEILGGKQWRSGQKRYAGLVRGLVVVSAFGLVSAAGAAAKTVTVGQLGFTPNQACAVDTFLQTGVASGRSYTVPKAGVITSWSFQEAVSTVPGLKLKVASSAGSGMYTTVAEAAAGNQTALKVNTFKAHIPVEAGDLIGLYESAEGECAADTNNSLDTLVYAPGDQAPGTTTSYFSAPGFKLPISVKVALDCVVPNLKGKTLKAAKKALKKAGCRLGKVRPEGQTKGKVKRQKPAAGKTLAPGAKVNVRLG
jgi:hypothetical protein